jgi:Acetyltransferase (GNAT) domain
MSQHIDDLPQLNGMSEPVVLRDSDIAEQIRVHHDDWLESLTAHRCGCLDLHPDLLAPGAAGPAAGLIVVAKWQNAGKGNRIAVLGPRVLRLHLLPGPALPVTLRGHRLMCNQIVGADSAAEMTPFVKAMSELLTSRQTESVLLEDVEVDGPLHRAVKDLVAGGAGQVAIHSLTAPQAHWWIDFPSEPAEYWKKFSAKTRQYFRSAARKLDHELVRFTAREDVERFLKGADQVSQRSWQSKRLGARVTDSAPMRAALERSAALGAFRSYLLEQRGRPIAFALCRQWNGKFDYQEIGYDMEFAERSPGTVLLYRLLEDLIAHDPPRWFDFDSGDADYKRMFGNRQTLSGPLMLTRRARKYSLIFGASRFSSRAGGQVRSWIGKSRPYKFLRQLYRR